MSEKTLDVDRLLAAFLQGSPYIAQMDLTVEEVDAETGSLRVRMPLKESFRRMTGQDMFHGGAISGLIDTVGDLAVALLVKGGVPTINFRVDYLRPAVGEAVVASASVRRMGRTVSVADVEVFDLEGRLCAVGRGTYGSQAG